MQLTTSLSFPHLTFKHWNLQDREVAILIVKGTFGIQADGNLGVMSEQLPIAEVDVFWGDENASSLMAEQDLAPAKPKTDVVVNAVARAPNEKPLTEWPVSIEIKGRAFYEFYVRGPSQWHKERGKWRLGESNAVTEVPIRYELAYGGFAPTDAEPEHYDFNPVGTGFVNEFLLKRDDPIPAPQIGDIAEFLAGDISAPMTVHGLGPIAKAWLPRRNEAGTFDDTWKATRHPRMPKDYSFAFWNCAPKRLQLEPPLTGGEAFVLKGFQHKPKPCAFRLPDVGVAIHLGGSEGPKANLTLTDVQIDIESTDASEHRICLIWRAMISDPDDIETLHIAATSRQETDNEQISNT